MQEKFPTREGTRTNIPEWLKPVVIAAGIGAVATVIVGFGSGGWVTALKSEAMAANRANAEAVAALAPICVAQSGQDPQAAATMTTLKETSNTSAVKC